MRSMACLELSRSAKIMSYTRENESELLKKVLLKEKTAEEAWLMFGRDGVLLPFWRLHHPQLAEPGATMPGTQV